MRQNILAVVVISGAVCFVIGLIGGVLLTMPNRGKTNSTIVAVEAKAEKAQQETKDAKEKTAQLQNELDILTIKLQNELNDLTTKLQQTNDQLKRAKMEIEQYKADIGQARAEIIRARAYVGKAKEETNNWRLECNKAWNELGIKRKHEAAKKEAEISEYDNQVAKMLSTGVIHSINVENNEVRIEPLLWFQLTLEQKQGLVMNFSHYFDLKGSTGRVTILSSQNDMKLATYGSWGGLKILK